MARNRWDRYKVSRSINGSKVVYLARAGKQKVIVGRADSRKDLIAYMTKASKLFEAQQAEILREAEERLAIKTAKAAKKSGLWKPGGMLKQKPTAASSKLAIKQAKSKRFTSSRTSNKAGRSNNG